MLNRENKIAMNARIRPINVEMFNNAIGDVGLQEIHDIRGGSTWTNRIVGEGRINRKLDRGFGNVEFHDLWPNVKLECHSGCTSYHCALTLELRHVHEVKKPFKFTNSWLRDGGIKEIVEWAWKTEVVGTPMYVFTMRLSKVKLALKR